MMGMRIVDAAMVVPERIQSADELAPLIGKTPDWIITRSGVTNRRVSEPADESPLLAAQAAKLVLQGNEPPDLILYAGGVQHQAIPDTSVFVSRALGLEGVPSFSIDSTCLSFLVALKTADAFLADGTYSRILICSADLGTRARNFNSPESAALLGDGAGAAIVERSSAEQGVLSYLMKTWSSAAGLAEIRGGGTGVLLNDPESWKEEHFFEMDGKGLLKLLKPELQKMLEECCDAAKIKLSDIDLVVPHQTSHAGFRLLEKLGLPATSTVNILSEFGNCVAAGMPMALAHAIEEERVKSGDLVLLVGSGAGVSAGMMLLRW